MTTNEDAQTRNGPAASMDGGRLRALRESRAGLDEARLGELDAVIDEARHDLLDDTELAAELAYAFKPADDGGPWDVVEPVNSPFRFGEPGPEATSSTQGRRASRHPDQASARHAARRELASGQDDQQAGATRPRRGTAPPKRRTPTPTVGFFLMATTLVMVVGVVLVLLLAGITPGSVPILAILTGVPSFVMVLMTITISRLAHRASREEDDRAHATLRLFLHERTPNRIHTVEAERRELARERADVIDAWAELAEQRRELERGNADVGVLGFTREALSEPRHSSWSSP